MPARGRLRVLSRRDILRIARRFNAGSSPPTNTVSKGRLKTRGPFSRPFGTCPLVRSNPALKRRASQDVPAAQQLASIGVTFRQTTTVPRQVNGCKPEQSPRHKGYWLAGMGAEDCPERPPAVRSNASRRATRRHHGRVTFNKPCNSGPGRARPFSGPFPSPTIPLREKTVP
jgi:hypothetical protein